MRQAVQMACCLHGGLLTLMLLPKVQGGWVIKRNCCCARSTGTEKMAEGKLGGCVGSAKVLQPNTKIVGLAMPETLKPMIVFLQFNSLFRAAFKLQVAPLALHLSSSPLSVRIMNGTTTAIYRANGELHETGSPDGLPLAWRSADPYKLLAGDWSCPNGRIGSCPIRIGHGDRRELVASTDAMIGALGTIVN
jgi:hypothetical protein